MTRTKSASKSVYKVFKKLGVVGYNRENNIYGINPLIVSSVFIILSSVLASVARKCVNTLMNKSIVKEMVLEFIATAELCAVCFELIIVADNYGIGAYAIYLFLLTVWWSSSWENATACPYNALEEVAEGSREAKQAVLLIIAQMLGAIVIFRYVQILWALELVETHIDRAYEDCTADLNVPMIFGAIIEGIATCLCRIMSRMLSDTDARYANQISAFFGTALVVAAFNYSGGYFNPALATSLKYGCEGNTFIEHTVVYWIGATLGSLASVYIYKIPCIQNCIKAVKPKED